MHKYGFQSDSSIKLHVSSSNRSCPVYRNRGKRHILLCYFLLEQCWFKQNALSQNAFICTDLPSNADQWCRLSVMWMNLCAFFKVNIARRQHLLSLGVGCTSHVYVLRAQIQLAGGCLSALKRSGNWMNSLLRWKRVFRERKWDNHLWKDIKNPR